MPRKYVMWTAEEISRLREMTKEMRDKKSGISQQCVNSIIEAAFPNPARRRKVTPSKFLETIAERPAPAIPAKRPCARAINGGVSSRHAATKCAVCDFEFKQPCDSRVVRLFDKPRCMGGKRVVDIRVVCEDCFRLGMMNNDHFSKHPPQHVVEWLEQPGRGWADRRDPTYQINTVFFNTTKDANIIRQRMFAEMDKWRGIYPNDTKYRALENDWLRNRMSDAWAISNQLAPFIELLRRIEKEIAPFDRRVSDKVYRDSFWNGESHLEINSHVDMVHDID